ncbi:MAG: hypothetical protein FJ388_08510, partial [Verrucomicrobia bacterium]|nr:hypothetical protein [Verrucomicrobiota bacterium]
MKLNLNRREFLTTTAATGVGLWAAACKPKPRTKLYKAMIRKPVEAEMRPLKEAGFDGFETNAILPPDEAAKGRELAEKIGLRIHSVLRGWAEFNSDDSAKVESSLKVTEDALRAAKAYGADAVLVVPCRIDPK